MRRREEIEQFTSLALIAAARVLIIGRGRFYLKENILECDSLFKNREKVAIAFLMIF